ncbi:MAG TPA: hypothetical protein VFC33_13205 [Acidimicrobiia bacterium]|nr:hypothetical protein [Acidimicrobiia bacterium]
MSSEKPWGAPAPPPAWGPGGQPPYPAAYPPGYGAGGYPPYPGMPYARQTEGMAIGALICAIGSFVVCPVVLAVVALVLAQHARNHIDAAQGRLTGTGLVTAARVIAWIHLALFALLLAGIIAFGLVVGTRG